MFCRKQKSTGMEFASDLVREFHICFFFNMRWELEEVEEGTTENAAYRL